MASPRSFEVRLQSTDGLDKYDERSFIVQPGTRAFLSKDDHDHITGFGIGRASKALGSNEFYQATMHNAWIDSPTISRKHAVLTVERNPPHLTIVNVAATHGLFVNDKKLDEKQFYLLQNGDIIRLSGEVRRGEELIPPRTFKIFFDPIDHTPPSSPDSVGAVRSYRVPEADTDDEGSVSDIDFDDHIQSDLPDVPMNDPSVTGFVQDSMLPSFSEVEDSDDQAMDSHLVFGYISSSSEDSNELDEDLDDLEHDQNHEPEYEPLSEDIDELEPKIAAESRQLLGLQMVQPQKSSGQQPDHRTTASTANPANHSPFLVQNPLFSKNLAVAQERPMTPNSNGADHGSVSPDPEGTKALFTDVLRELETGKSEMISAPTNTTAIAQVPFTSFNDIGSLHSLDKDRQRKEVDDELQFENTRSQYEADRSAPPCQEVPPQSKFDDSVTHKAAHAINYNLIAPSSMSLNRILDLSTKNAGVSGPSNISPINKYDWSGNLCAINQNSIAPPIDNRAFRYANPRHLYDHPFNEYNEGPFAAVKIGSMLNNEPPKLPTSSGHPNATKDIPSTPTLPSQDVLSTKKSGISILDIVDNTETKEAATVRPLKRKASDMEDASSTVQDASDIKEVSENVPFKESTVETNDKSSVLNVEPEKIPHVDDQSASRPNKKQKTTAKLPNSAWVRKCRARKAANNSVLHTKTNTLATVAAGAVMGGLAVFSALAFLPEAIFQ